MKRWGREEAQKGRERQMWRRREERGANSKKWRGKKKEKGL
jgi:hypothetical protein